MGKLIFLALSMSISIDFFLLIIVFKIFPGNLDELNLAVIIAAFFIFI